MTRTLIICVVLLITTSFYLSADNFKDFVKEQETEFSSNSEDFDQYKKDVLREYRAYRQVVQEEYDKFRNELSKYWKETEVGDQKRWVEYSNDLKTRKIVDFEKNTIEVDIIVPPKKKDPKEKKPSTANIDQEINKILKDLLLEDKQTALNRDKLTENIQKRINDKGINVKSDNVENKPILTTAITGSSKPSEKQINQVVKDLRKKESVVTQPSKLKNTDVLKVTIPLPSDFPVKKAMEFKSDINHFARDRKIDDALVFAVVHTESAFNPMARSPIPAYGLMQVVPRSAGLDATNMIYGKQVLLSPEYLYNAKNNINIGTTYIHILYYRYLKNIENPESRLYCTIAAYNTGAGNVAKAFVGSTNIGKAVGVINKMPPEKVYDRLIRRLPYSETRKYLSNVSKRLDIYKSMDSKVN